MMAPTDIRLMFESLRPQADFRAAVERTIESLPARTSADLIAFWQTILDSLTSDEDPAETKRPTLGYLDNEAGRDAWRKPGLQ